MSFGKLRNLIFDWDNTLFDFKGYWEKAHEITYKTAFDWQNKVNYEDFMSVYRENDRLLWEKVLTKEISLDELRIQRTMLTAHSFGEKLTESEAKIFFDKFYSQLLEMIEPEVLLLNRLKNLQKSYDISILTNGKSDEQREKLRRTGFLNQIPVYISDEIGLEKPDLNAFLHVIKDRNLKIAQTAMIGDSLENDILPARQIGLQTISIGKVKFPEANDHFSSINEFLDKLEECDKESKS